MTKQEKDPELMEQEYLAEVRFCPLQDLIVTPFDANHSEQSLPSTVRVSSWLQKCSLLTVKAAKANDKL